MAYGKEGRDSSSFHEQDRDILLLPDFDLPEVGLPVPACLHIAFLDGKPASQELGLVCSSLILFEFLRGKNPESKIFLVLETADIRRVDSDTEDLHLAD